MRTAALKVCRYLYSRPLRVCALGAVEKIGQRITFLPLCLIVLRA